MPAPSDHIPNANILQRPSKPPYHRASPPPTTRVAPMTYYANGPYGTKRPTPLINFIPDHNDQLDASDEEDSFYGKDDDFLLPKHFHTKFERVPRRIKRYSVIGLVTLFVFLICWWTFLGARVRAYRREIWLMDEGPEMVYGSNARHTFKDMIQVKDMDTQHLPKKGKRLVFVGDVHGCRKELEHLLKKVGFRHKHDHLILTGDMISKGKAANRQVKWRSLILSRPRLPRRRPPNPRPRRLMRPRQLGR